MWVFAVIASMAAAFALFITDGGADTRLVDAARSRVLAQSMATYRAAVVDMARAHPTFDGPVGEASLSLPAWWQTQPGLKATVEGRTVAVYLETGEPPPDLLQEMLRLATGSMLVGIASRASGTLHAPSVGDTGIAVPAAVPDGVPVWLATRD